MAIGGFRICQVTWECCAVCTFGDFFCNLWKVLWPWSLIIGGHFIWHYPGSLKLFSDAILLVVCSYSGAGAVSPSLSSMAPLASPALVSSAGWVFALTQLLPFLDSDVSVRGCLVLGLQGNNWILKLKLGGGYWCLCLPDVYATKMDISPCSLLIPFTPTEGGTVLVAAGSSTSVSFKKKLGHKVPCTSAIIFYFSFSPFQSIWLFNVPQGVHRSVYFLTNYSNRIFKG